MQTDDSGAGLADQYCAKSEATTGATQSLSQTRKEDDLRNRPDSVVLLSRFRRAEALLIPTPPTVSCRFREDS